MLRGIFLILALLACRVANATPCTETPFYDGFSGQFYGAATVTGFIYGLDDTYLYVTLTNGLISGFINMPQSVAQQFQYSKTPDTFYATQIQGRYRQPLMTETCQNLLTESGFYIIAF